ncbi:MAG TPA: hypothetical protein VGM07_12100 [Stellaceae bacterium]
MLTIAEAQKRTEEFLTGQMLEALAAVEYELPSFDEAPRALARISHRAAADVGFSDVSGCLSGFWGREPGVLSLSGRG